MISFNTLVRKAIIQARKSNYKQKVGAVIYDKNTILSEGHNSVNRFCRKIKSKYREWPNSLHAELDAVLRSKKDLKGATILVVRINNSESLMLAKPCSYCMSYLLHVGIKRVIYSISHFPYWEIYDIE